MYTFTCSNNHWKVTWETEDKHGLCFVCSAKGVEVTPSASDNSAMDAINTYIVEYENQLMSTDDSKIGLAACEFIDKYANIFRRLLHQ